MIATSGLHDSFSRIKKLAFAIRHARWNVGNFKKGRMSLKTGRNFFKSYRYRLITPDTSKMASVA